MNSETLYFVVSTERLTRNDHKGQWVIIRYCSKLVHVFYAIGIQKLNIHT